VNEGRVNGRGIELAALLIPTEKLQFTGNFTFQGNEITTPRLTSSSLQGAQVPNIPNLFFNLGITYRVKDPFTAEGNLEFFWNYFFIDRFSINEVKDLDTANPDFVIPIQNLHNTGVAYILNDSGLSFSFTLRNILNDKIYDNFRIPRPGRNFAFKILYSL
jgi:outer membrane receptor protein involved in Fe transport